MRYCMLLVISIVASMGAITNLEQSTIDAAKTGDAVAINANLARVRRARKAARDRGRKRMPRFSLNAQDASSKTALHWAAHKGYVDIAKTLSNAGADVNAQDGYGRTPLHYAALADEADVIQVLTANKKIDVNKPDLMGDTPLHLAAHRGNTSAVKALVSAHANINARNDAEKTPYDETTCTNSKECAQALLAQGAEAHRFAKSKNR